MNTDKSIKNTLNELKNKIEKITEDHAPAPASAVAETKMRGTRGVKKRKTGKIDFVLASGFEWKKPDLNKWTAEENGRALEIVKTSENHYSWKITSVNQEDDNSVITGKTHGYAFWDAANDVRRAVKTV